MGELIATLLLGAIKMIFEARARKRLNDQEFMAHIRAHQIRRKNTGRAAMNFEEALRQAELELDIERKLKQEKQNN